jgi:essential nuclear protein 1
VKKSIFKTGAFFKGFLLPLAEDATAREAVIIGSILGKMSINTLDAAAATMKLAQMPYRIGSGFFLKTMLSKKYALPTVVISTLIEFFMKFENEGYTNEDDQEEMEMPVMWHQTLLTYVQCYRNHLTYEMRQRLKALVKVQMHPTITSEIRKYLANAPGEDAAHKG